MTRRERLTRKMEKREEWADKAAARSTAAFNAAHKIADGIPFGQPILVGHHSEKHARADQNRIHNAMGRGCERQQMAAHHTSVAGNLADALDRSIYSDDTDAVETLTTRIAEREAEREKMKTVNKLYRKGDAAGLAALGFNLESLRDRLKDAHSWEKQPYAAYELSNLGGRITADRKRLEQIKIRQQRSASADAAPNGVAFEKCDGGYCRVTFAEKPEREILDALKAAGFFWGSGSWAGKLEKLPRQVAELVTPEPAPAARRQENAAEPAKRPRAGMESAVSSAGAEDRSRKTAP